MDRAARRTLVARLAQAAPPQVADQFELTLNEPSAFAALVEGALTGLK
jgi:hypothetical protein